MDPSIHEGSVKQAIELRLKAIRRYFSKPRSLTMLRTGVLSLEDTELSALVQWVKYATHTLQMTMLAKGQFEDILQLENKTFIQVIPEN